MRAHLGLVVASMLTAGVVLGAGGPRLPIGLDLYRPVPETNPITPAKVALGHRLFHDRRLSRDGSTSCATCHDPRRAFADNRRVAVGIRGARGRRNVPAIVNRAWGQTFFWDGRAATLEQQALHPILNPLELGGTPAAAVALAQSVRYRADFKRAFGAEPDLDDVGRALATYVRTIVSGDSPYDRLLSGRPSALDASGQRGLTLFMGRAGCASCHSGPTFTDEDFHNTGVAWRNAASSTGSGQARSTGAGQARSTGSGQARSTSSGQGPSDIGRAAVTGRVEDRGAFKTPTLREVARTAPYMHDGSIATLEEVIDYYDRGGQRNPGLASRLRPLGLTPGDRRDLRAFLHSLSGRVSDGR